VVPRSFPSSLVGEGFFVNNDFHTQGGGFPLVLYVRGQGMGVYLAATWDPRGELVRLERLQPILNELYCGMVVIIPPGAGPEVREGLQALGFQAERPEGAPDERARLRYVAAPDWSWGRYLALQKALSGGAGSLQYADLDRLLRWAETRPQELRAAVENIRGRDCLIFGRSAAAYQTHPQCLVRTEAISNRVVSYLLGRSMDVSAGSKAFSRRAAEFILANSRPGRALGTDAEWPLLLYRGGFRIDYQEVDGLDWESADRYQAAAAGSDGQRRAAEAVDRDPASWARRVEVALEIVESGLDSLERELVSPPGSGAGTPQMER